MRHMLPESWTWRSTKNSRPFTKLRECLNLFVEQLVEFIIEFGYICSINQKNHVDKTAVLWGFFDILNQYFN